MITLWIWKAVKMTNEWDTYQLLMQDLRWARKKNLRSQWGKFNAKFQ